MASKAQSAMSQGDNLLDHIYEAAVMPERWRDTLGHVASFVEADDAILMAVRSGEVRGFVASSTRFEELAVEHFKRFPDSVRTKRLIAAQSPGFLQDIDVFDPEEIRNEPIYRDFLIPAGLGRAAATAIYAPTDEVFIVNVERPFAKGPYVPAAIGALDHLRPHLARAALLSAHLEIERYRVVTQALDAMGLPASVVSDTGKALEANRRFVRLIPRLFVDQPARLACTDPAPDRLLREALANASKIRHPQPIGSIPLCGDEEHPPHIVHVVPICRTARDVFGRALCILVVTPVTQASVPTPSIIQGLFDLTPSESKLAALIAGGARPRTAAQSLGITEESARTVLKTVFFKTGVSRQADLVALLGGKRFGETE